MFLVSRLLFQDIQGINYYDISSDKKSQEIFFLFVFLRFFIFQHNYFTHKLFQNSKFVKSAFQKPLRKDFIYVQNFISL